MFKKKRALKKAEANTLREVKAKDKTVEADRGDAYMKKRNKKKKKVVEKEVKVVETKHEYTEEIEKPLVQTSIDDVIVDVGRVGDEIYTRSVIDPKRLGEIRTRMRLHSIDLYLKAIMDTGIYRERMRKILRGYPEINSEDEITYALEEILGLGEFQVMLDIPSVTDISYDGQSVHVKTNTVDVQWFTKLDSKYVEGVVTRISVYAKKSFTNNDSILDAELMNIRINAIHPSLSKAGVSLSIRLSHARLVLNDDNFVNAAPVVVADLLRGLIRARVNMVLIGETGAGKTELQKYILGAIDVEDKIIVIEDTAELRLKTLYPDKHVVSLETNEDYEIKDLLRPALRSNPKWIIVSETRGMEIYQLIQAAQTGHSMVTSLHVDSLRGVPDRVVGMINEGYGSDEDRIEKIALESFNIGVQMWEHNFEGVTYRYIREIVEYSAEKVTTILEQRMIGDELFVTRVGHISDKLKGRMSEEGVQYVWGPDIQPLDPERGIPGELVTYTRFYEEGANKGVDVIEAVTEEHYEGSEEEITVEVEEVYVEESYNDEVHIKNTHIEEEFIQPRGELDEYQEDYRYHEDQTTQHKEQIKPVQRRNQKVVEDQDIYVEQRNSNRRPTRHHEVDQDRFVDNVYQEDARVVETQVEDAPVARERVLRSRAPREIYVDEKVIPVERELPNNQADRFSQLINESNDQRRPGEYTEHREVEVHENFNNHLYNQDQRELENQERFNNDVSHQGPIVDQHNQVEISEEQEDENIRSLIMGDSVAGKPKKSSKRKNSLLDSLNSINIQGGR